MKVVIIGSGNVATVLGRKLVAAGLNIVQVVGRNIENAATLAKELNAAYSSNPKEINLLADIYIIAVNDSSIIEVAKELQLGDKLIVHTAGSVSKEVLRSSSGNYGVIYPLQSLRKELETIPLIPVLIDGSNTETTELLRSFCVQWSDSIAITGDSERLKIHLSAVIVNNFTNHLLAQTEKFCEEEQLNFNLLQPLIEETVLRIKNSSPAKLQTGPAFRNDLETIRKHEELLSNYKELKELYKFMNNSIANFYAAGNDL